MNIALIFAGGTGKRMNSKTVPKQFLELNGKPIIIYTLEKFEYHDEIDAIVVACLESWMPRMWKLVRKYHLNKVRSIVHGGSTGQESIYNGLSEISTHYPDDSVILVHDGVRPMVDTETISRCIACCREKGSAITVTPATETIILDSRDDEVGTILQRSQCQLAKAPQTFFLKDLMKYHEMARKEGLNDFIDSANLARHYGHKLYTVEGKTENIKITTPIDYYIFQAITAAHENSQVFGF